MDIKQEICSWIGKRWIHGQAVKSEGADCIQYIVAVAKTLEWLPPDFKSIKYSSDWAVHNERSIMREEISKVAIQIDNINKLEIGDIILIISGKTAGHAGFYIGDGQIVHSHIRHGITQENLSKYSDKIDSFWRFKKCH